MSEETTSISQDNGKVRLHIVQYAEQISLVIDPPHATEMRLTPAGARELAKLLTQAADGVKKRAKP